MKKYILIIIGVLGFIFSLNAQTQNLNYFITKALANSPLLKKQINNNKIIDIDLKQFNAIYKSPKISLNSSILFAPIISKDGTTNKFQLTSSGSTNYIGYDLGASNGGQYQAITSITQPLFTAKQYSVQKNNVLLTKSKNENKIALTKADLKQLVTHQYILCLQAQKKQANNQKIIQVIKTQLERMKFLVKSGVYKYSDLKLLEIELLNWQIAYNRSTTDYLTNFNALKLLSGINDTKIFTLADLQLSLNLISKKTSIFLKKYVLDSLSINAEQKISELKYKPQVSAFSDAGLNATYTPSLDRLGFSVGLSLNWNLFDGRQKQLKRKQNKILLDNIIIDKNYFENQNTIRKNNILSEIESVNNQLLLIDNQIKKYNDLLDLYKIEINKSLISVLELKTVINDIAAKKQEKTNTLMLKQILINSYNYWNN
ncbi:MAG: TolC family protein [Lutibacter sp.]|uniref:TolC family protein n=1 Tax=Lutibacter sp. TaxID=1925666 RepID=UPI00299EF2F1|nr:TolC family protein [Lutibacter sp.]MDX1828372.1 TolC family protein [Lutibacter sp.]